MPAGDHVKQRKTTRKPEIANIWLNKHDLWAESNTWYTALKRQK